MKGRSRTVDSGIIPLRALASAALSLLLASTQAPAAPLSLDDAFARQTIFGVSLSPDGSHLVARAYSKDASAVLLIDASTLESKTLYAATSYQSFPLAVRWVGDEIVAVQSIQNGIFTLSLDGKLQRNINGRMLSPIGGAQPGHEMVFIEKGGFYRKVGARSGDEQVVSVDLPYGTNGLVFDTRGVARVARTQRKAAWSDDTNVTYWYRAKEADEWRELESFPVLGIAWDPIAVSKDDRSLIVSSRVGRDTLAIFRYDVETRRMGDMLAGHPREDIASFQRTDDEAFEWVKTSGLKPTIHWFDASGAALQQAVDGALPGRVNTLIKRAGHRALIYSSSDVEPGAWYLLDMADGSLRRIASVNPRVKPEEMRPTQAITYRSEDGLDIPAYLTLPAGTDKHLPTVVLVHGGPVARDFWGYDAEVQLLASRGYAVFQPQFRGSSGFGKHFEDAGINQWGRAMQDDVTAGTRWLFAQGIADEKRTCIFGASYGGYAAMWAMVKTPTLFRCGISYAGISDLNDFFSGATDISQSAIGRLYLRDKFGDLEAMRGAFDEVSPLKRAGEFQVPVLVMHGNRDTRVAESQSKALVSALRAKQKPVEWVELDGEGHSIGGEKNREKFFGALFDFLDRNIGEHAPAAQ